MTSIPCTQTLHWLSQPHAREDVADARQALASGSTTSGEDLLAKYAAGPVHGGPTSWQVQVAPGALSSLDRFPPHIAGAIVDFVTRALPENAEQASNPPRYQLVELRSAHHSDYWVLFIPDEATRALLVVRISHRDDAYVGRTTMDLDVRDVGSSLDARPE